MCIIHDLSLHHVFQNMILAFEQSRLISALFLKRVGCLICTCKKEIYYDSKTIFSTQRSLYQWFDESLKDLTATERLCHFKPIVDEFKSNGHIDSGTKITFMLLLKDVYLLDFSKLRTLTDEMKNTKEISERNFFFTTLVKLKFDLSLCSAKVFTELLNKIDNCAIKYIEVTNHSKITLRNVEHLSLRHFMGQVEATIEAKTEKSLKHAERGLKLLADAVHYRMIKELSSSDEMSNFGQRMTPSTNMKVLIQSPQQSIHKSFDMTPSLQSHETSLNETPAHKTKNIYKNRKFSNKSPSTSLDENDSFLNISQYSIDNKTPLTSSPASSPASSNAPITFWFKKNPINNKANKFESNITSNFRQNLTYKCQTFDKNRKIPKSNDHLSQYKSNYNNSYNDFDYSNKLPFNGYYSNKSQTIYSNVQ